jgi:hypothetical protein
MNKIYFTFLVLLAVFIMNLSVAVPVFAQQVLYTDDPSVEEKFKTTTKIDSTGGLQSAGGVYFNLNLTIAGFPMSTSKRALNLHRGPDVLNPCAFYGLSLVTDSTTECGDLVMDEVTALISCDEEGPGYVPNEDGICILGCPPGKAPVDGVCETVCGPDQTAIQSGPTEPGNCKCTDTRKEVNASGRCVIKCPGNLVYDPTPLPGKPDGQCVCPDDLEGPNSNGVCVNQCPAGCIDPDGSGCVTANCPSGTTDPAHSCKVEQCCGPNTYWDQPDDGSAGSCVGAMCREGLVPFEVEGVGTTCICPPTAKAFRGDPSQPDYITECICNSPSPPALSLPPAGREAVRLPDTDPLSRTRPCQCVGAYMKINDAGDCDEIVCNNHIGVTPHPNKTCLCHVASGAELDPAGLGGTCRCPATKTMNTVEQDLDRDGTIEPEERGLNKHQCRELQCTYGAFDANNNCTCDVTATRTEGIKTSPIDEIVTCTCDATTKINTTFSPARCECGVNAVKDATNKICLCDTASGALMNTNTKECYCPPDKVMNDTTHKCEIDQTCSSTDTSPRCICERSCGAGQWDGTKCKIGRYRESGPCYPGGRESCGIKSGNCNNPPGSTIIGGVPTPYVEMDGQSGNKFNGCDQCPQCLRPTAMGSCYVTMYCEDVFKQQGVPAPASCPQ